MVGFLMRHSSFYVIMILIVVHSIIIIQLDICPTSFDPEASRGGLYLDIFMGGVYCCFVVPARLWLVQASPLIKK